MYQNIAEATIPHLCARSCLHESLHAANWAGRGKLAFPRPCCNAVSIIPRRECGHVLGYQYRASRTVGRYGACQNGWSF